MNADSLELLKITFQERMAALESQVSDCRCGATPACLPEEIKELKNEFLTRIQALESKMVGFEERLEQIERFRRRKMLILHGASEDLSVGAALQAIPLKIEATSVSDSYRIGRKSEKPRPILIKFKSFDGKKEIWKEKSKLKNSRWLLTESLTPLALGLLKEAKKKFGNNSAWTMNGNVFFKHKDNTINKISKLSDLNNVPKEKNCQAMKLRQRPKKLPTPNTAHKTSL
jgi:hypothetical protein